MPKEQGEVSVNRWVAMFMTACVPVEKYLMGGHPLTDIEADSMTSTIEGLRTALDVWKRKNRRPSQQSFVEVFNAARLRPRKRKKTATQRQFDASESQS